MESGKEKNIYFEVLRVVAVFCVVGVHGIGTIIAYSPEGYGYEIWNKILISLSNLGVPIFLMISGFFLLGRPVENVFKWYKKRVIKILPAFLFWGLIYSIYFAGIEQHDIANIPMFYVKGLLCNTIHPTYWFVYTILGFYFITPFLSKMLNAMSEVEISILVGVCIFINALQDIFRYFEMDFALAELIFNQRNLMYYICGYCIYRLFKAKQLHISNMNKIMLLVILLCIRFIMNDCFVLTILVVMLLALPNNINLGKACMRVVQEISDHSYSIYLSHTALISVLFKIYKNWNELYFFKSIIIVPVILVATYCFTLIPDLLINKIIKKVISL